MDETDLISSLQERLSSVLSVPVRTSGLEDERPVPAVIIDDWDTQEENFNNSSKSGEYGRGGSLEWYLTFNFMTRVEFVVRHNDEVEVSRLKEKVKQELRFMRENPQGFHSDLKECRPSGGGNPTYTYTEPKEAELVTSARFYGDHTVTRTASDVSQDVISDVIDEFTFNT